MDSDSLTVLSLDDEPVRFSSAIGSSLRTCGFAVVTDHGIDPALVAKGWRLTAEFFALPEDEKRGYHRPDLSGARGYTPFGVETAKGAAVHDLKEFWHVGRDLPANNPLTGTMPPNLWPVRPAGFRDTFEHLFAQFDRVGAVILSRIAANLSLAEDWFTPAIADGNSVLRLLHYPPLVNAPEGAVRSAEHEDINLITLLLGAEEAGLELLSRDGRWLNVAPPAGALVVNIGDMLQRLSNHVLPSTTHRVRRPDAARAHLSRYAMPFFLHLRSDFPLATLAKCIGPDRPDRYPHTISADDYLHERLREIGLKK